MDGSDEQATRQVRAHPAACGLPAVALLGRPDEQNPSPGPVSTLRAVGYLGAEAPGGEGEIVNQTDPAWRPCTICETLTLLGCGLCGTALCMQGCDCPTPECMAVVGRKRAARGLTVKEGTVADNVLWGAILEELMVWVADCPACPGGGVPCAKCDPAKALIARGREEPVRFDEHGRPLRPGVTYRDAR